MSRFEGARASHGPEEIASRLGRLGGELTVSVSRAEDAAAKQRLLMALGRQRPKAWSRVLLAAAVFALAISGALLGGSRQLPSLAYRVVGPAVPQGEWLDVPAKGGAVALRFSEGTEVELGPGSKGRVASLTAHGASIVLDGGALHARVVHRPRAHWSVSAGPFDIQVTGTAFDVAWSAASERLEVALHDGSVVVQGPSLLHGVRVVAGQRLVARARVGEVELSSLFDPQARDTPAASASVDPAAAIAPSAAAASATATATVTATASAAVGSVASTEVARVGPAFEKEAPPSRPPNASWSELVSSGDFRAVLESARARGLEQTFHHANLRDLAALSDAARYAGERALARRGLLLQRTRFASSAEARAAAFVLGRMADDAGTHTEALKWYDDYLREAPHGAFAAEALGRKLVVLVRIGRSSAAREVAEAYVQRFPTGPHLAYAQEVLRSP